MVNDLPPVGYRPDAALAVVWALLASARLLAFLATFAASWRESLGRSETMLFEWISGTGSWPAIASILLVGAFSLWAAIGIRKGRGWAFVVVAYLCALDVVTQLGRHPATNPVARYGLPLYVLVFLGCGLRAVGAVGPRIAIS